MNINHNNIDTNKTDEMQCNDAFNTSFPPVLHSNCSSSSNETDLSFLLSELDMINRTNISLHNADELPAFEIRSLSPHGRTPSPIDNDCASNHNRLTASPELQQQLGEDYITLMDLNAQISPPNDENAANNLETIYEGVYLNTPPKPERKSKLYDLQHIKSKRIQLLEKEAYKMLKSPGKENCSPKI